MRKDFGILRKLILEVWRRSQRAWRKRSDSRATLYTYDRLISSKRQMSETEVEQLMPTDGGARCDFGESDGYFYLPPLERGLGFVPLLVLWCDLDTSGADISVKVAFYKFAREPKEEQSFGFRFEGPHAGGDEGDRGEADGTNERLNVPSVGRHEFYHAQLITLLRKASGRERFTCPEWMHEHIPAFPLKAECPVCLFLCMLASLYGRGFDRYFDPRGIDRECMKHFKGLVGTEDTG